MAQREEIAAWLKELQSDICKALETADGKSNFTIENWTRPEGGGGITRVLGNGNVIEKGGVNFSAVHGKTPAFLLTEKEHSSSVEYLGTPNFQMVYFSRKLSVTDSHKRDHKMCH